VARGWAAVTVVVAVVGVLIELGVVIAGVSSVLSETTESLAARLWHFISYFTILSNLLVIVSVLPLITDPRHDGRRWRVLRLAALLTGWYPYPFLDVADRGAGPVAITGGAIALLLVGLAWVCWRLDRVLGARPTPDGSASGR